MYKTKLDIKKTQKAIELLKFTFTKELHKNLNLTRVSAPLFVFSSNKINDGLNGEKPVIFNAKTIDQDIEIVHSLAKWKRIALKKYKFDVYEGIWTDMNAIRREEDLDNKHSLYVDQWDWEMIIKQSDRNLDFLFNVVKKIYKSILHTERKLNIEYVELREKLPKTIKFISSIELYNLYPNLTPEEREREIVKLHGAVFVYGIGNKLNNGLEHSKRAFDYDDWTLNGDLLFYDKINDDCLEISSMGIRVDKNSLLNQKQKLNKSDEYMKEYHQMILNNQLPFTIGGGIGQSRLSMFLLEKKHIAEVQVSLWDEQNNNFFEENNIEFL